MFEQEEKEGPVEGKKYTYNNVPGMITYLYQIFLNFIHVHVKK